MLKSFLKTKLFLFKIRLFFGVLLLILILIFLYLKIVPFGKITYIRAYPEFIKSGKGFIYGFTPANRVDLISGVYPKINGEPVYFSVFTPRTFDQARLTITYKNHLSSTEPIIEAGVLMDNIVWNYDLKPLQNDIIDALKKNWSRLENGSKILLQKEKQYANWAALEADLAQGKLKNCPAGINQCLATYNYNLYYNYRDNSYRNSEPLIIETPLRGAHQLYVYLNNRSLYLKFNFINLRQDKAGDPIIVNLYSENNKLISSKYLGDQEAKSFDPKTGAEAKEVIINEPNLVNGLYKIEVKVRDDTVIKRIESSSDRLVFINKLWPVSALTPLTLFTDASYLQTKVFSPASRQTISFGDQDFVLDKTYDQINLFVDNQKPIQKIRLVKDDVILENNGVFAFSQSSLFNPSALKIDRFFKLNDDIKYILADYEAPLDYVADGFKTKSVEFNTKEAYRENGKYSFMISVPGIGDKALTSAASSSAYLEIKEIRIDFSGRTLWQKIFQKNNDLKFVNQVNRDNN